MKGSLTPLIPRILSFLWAIDGKIWQQTIQIKLLTSQTFVINGKNYWFDGLGNNNFYISSENKSEL